MNLITAISPLNKLFAWVGLFPIETTADGNLQITNKGIFGSLLALTFVVVYGIASVFAPNYVKTLSNGSSIAILVRDIIYYGCVFVSTTAIILEVINRKRIVRIITNIQDIDNCISRNIDVFPMKIDYNLLHKKAQLAAVVIISCHVFIELQDFVLITDEFVEKDFLTFVKVFLKYYTTFTVLLMIIIKFTCLCFLIKQRIFWINELLYNTANLEEIQCSLDSSQDSKDKAMYLIFLLHSKLYRISNELNASYSVQITLCVAQTFLVLTKQCFYIILMVLDGEDILTNTNIISRFIWSVYQMLLLSLMTTTCYKITKEATRTGDILHALIYRRNGKNMSDNTKKMLQFYSLQILHCSPRFSAAGFFDIDMALIKSVIASITTYLVILIQFNLSQGKNSL